MELLNFVIGVAALIVAVVAIIIERRHRAEDARQQEQERREQDAQRAKADREKRIDAITERYVRQIPATSGLDGALRAGVTDLADSSEVAEFAKRAAARMASDPVLPQSVRERVHPDQLLSFFQLLASTPNWTQGVEFEKILTKFRKV